MDVGMLQGWDKAAGLLLTKERLYKDMHSWGRSAKMKFYALLRFFQNFLYFLICQILCFV